MTSPKPQTVVYRRIKVTFVPPGNAPIVQFFETNQEAHAAVFAWCQFAAAAFPSFLVPTIELMAWERKQS